MRARVPAILAVASLACVALAWAALPAIGDEVDRITIREGETIVREYPPLAASHPGRGKATSDFDEEVSVTPDECRQLDSTCDVIPVTAMPPAQAGEFLLRFTLFFEAEQVAPLLTATHNDLDMYLWDDPAGDNTIDTRSDEDDGDRNPGASYRTPERINFFTDQPGNYQLVVSNFASSEPVPYTLEVKYASGSIPPAFESLDPTATPRPSGPAASGAGGDGGTPSPAAPGEQPGVADTAPTDADTTLDPALLGLDPDFAAIDGRDLDTALAAPPSLVSVPTRAVAVARPPSALALALWFGLVPLLLLGVAGWLLVRANPTLVRPVRRQAPAG